uniref:Lon N-terminal domain-containing protein n=1 Tax=Haptolina ericina TaxID=156174 RepID=A0A7S3B1T9_9EUKA|mmetsp:Transcript_47392/g.106882  ORF Transcript_47392/g.106882 Transcript_47392/m.106882 type:complete len:262 (+) Transcript_47392:1-786(+)
MSLPRSPEMVVEHLRNAFEAPPDTPDAPDAFAVLRKANLSQRTLWPPGEQYTDIPAFVLPGHTLLVGERARFVLFEPRYLRLAQLALDRSDAIAAKFIHLPLPKADAIANGFSGPVGTLVTITSHELLADGRYLIECQAGPRCSITYEQSEPMEGAAPLLRVDVALSVQDEPQPSVAEEDAALAQRCLELVCAGSPGFFSRLPELPPLFNTERLSFFFCHLLLDNDEVEHRLQWLHSRSTGERLRFCHTRLQTWLASKSGS